MLWSAQPREVNTPQTGFHPFTQHARHRTDHAVAWGLFMLGTLSVIFVRAATMFQNLRGWGFWHSVVGTAVLVGADTVCGRC